MPFFRKRRESPQVNPDDRSPKTGIRYKDLEVVSQLVKHGADLTQPRHALYYLYFASEHRAQLAADEARARNFAATVSAPRPALPDQWSLICERHDIVLDLATIRSNADFFEALADSHHGDYDGWEAAAN